MCKFKRYIAIIFTFLFFLTLTANSVEHNDVTARTLDVINNFSSEFRKPAEKLKPVTLDLKEGLYKNIFSGFNAGYEKLSRFEPLPVTFDSPESVKVPVILYHHVTKKQGYGQNVISALMLEKHLIALKNAGYSTVSAKEMIDYVYYGSPLPEKPLLITFDDGYLSNYELAYPLFKKYNMKATFFAIGWAIGKKNYKDGDTEIIPHFNFAHAREMVSSGLIEVQSHTYDMHQSAELENAEIVRENVLKSENESIDQYRTALHNDYKKMDKELFNNVGYTTYAVAYPHGEYSEISEEVFSQLGAKITFSTRYTEENVLTQGDYESLRVLDRFTITESISPTQLISLINSVYKDKQENYNE